MRYPFPIDGIANMPPGNLPWSCDWPGGGASCQSAESIGYPKGGVLPDLEIVEVHRPRPGEKSCKYPLLEVPPTG